MRINLHYLREPYLIILKRGIEKNIGLYKKNDSWLENYFKNESCSMTSNIFIDTINLIDPKDRNDYDLENTKIIYEALKNLKIAQATDERLWTYLTHVNFWNYMRKRWPVDGNKKLKLFIRDRYFFMGNRHRALTRNGIARLWWFGRVTYDNSRNNPFELTEVLLKNQDIAMSLLERNFSNNITITKIILSELAEYENYTGTFPNREEIRGLFKYINWLGGVTVLDALDENDLRKIIRKKLEMPKKKKKKNTASVSKKLSALLKRSKTKKKVL